MSHKTYHPCFLTHECAHAHEQVIAIMAFSLGRLVGSVVLSGMRSE